MNSWSFDGDELLVIMNFQGSTFLAVATYRNYTFPFQDKRISFRLCNGGNRRKVTRTAEKRLFKLTNSKKFKISLHFDLAKYNINCVFMT